MEELETVRSTLSRLEGTLEERREDLDPSTESTSVRVVPTTPRAEPDLQTWELGETVRIIPPADRQPSRPEPPEESALEPEVEEGEPPRAEPPRRPRVASIRPDEPMHDKPEPDEAPESEDVTESSSVMDEELPPAGEPQTAGVVIDEKAPDDVGALFASLRGSPEATITVQTATTRASEPVSHAREIAPAPDTDLGPRSDVIEMRDNRLLPIANRALRGVKKAVTDAQNVALDSLRTDGSWHPEGPALAEMMRADLIGLWAESYSAGHAVAEEMIGSKLRRGDTPTSDAAETFGADLAGAVSSALIDAGDGQREKQSATSRVFRGWRTDEVERRVRELALVGYHRGMVDSMGDENGLEWVASGTPCSACRAAASEPGSTLPPVHHGCECTLALVEA